MCGHLTEHIGRAAEPPEVDFEREYVVAVFQVGSAVAAVDITSLDETDRGTLVAMVRRPRFTGGDCDITAEDLSYFHIVAVERGTGRVPTDGEVELDEPGEGC